MAAGHRSLITGADPPYFLWPGVPSGETSLVCLFERRHYGRADTNFNMDIDLARTPGDPGGHRLAGPEDAAELDEWMATHWSNWRLEVLRALDKGNLVIARADGDGGPVTAFCAFEVNRRGVLGPVAVRPDLMGRRCGQGRPPRRPARAAAPGRRPGGGRVGGPGRAVRRGRRSGERRVLRLPQGAQREPSAGAPNARADRGDGAEPSTAPPPRRIAASPGLRAAYRPGQVSSLSGATTPASSTGRPPWRSWRGSTPAPCRPARCATIPTSPCAASCSTCRETRCRP